MVGNFNFAEKEFDAFLIKKEGIVLIEFKNYGGKITVSNNEWKGEYLRNNNYNKNIIIIANK